MKKEIELKGYSFADGVHWDWDGKEIAIIDPVTSDIEWCVKKISLPTAVVEAVKAKRPQHNRKWTIEVRRVDLSATQGEILVFINRTLIANFADKKVLGEDGMYRSIYTDEELGKFVASTFWHPYDSVYHFSRASKLAFGIDKDDPINALPKQNIYVETLAGTLHAYPSIDKDYPGIYIDLERNGKSCSVPLVLLDYSHTEFPECQDTTMAEKGVLVCRCWKDVRKEDYCEDDRTVFTGYDEFFAE